MFLIAVVVIPPKLDSYVVLKVNENVDGVMVEEETAEARYMVLYCIAHFSTLFCIEFLFHSIIASDQLNMCVFVSGRKSLI